MHTVNSEHELRKLREEYPALLVYFSSPGCRVCQVIGPRIEALARSGFGHLHIAYVDCVRHPAIAAQYQVFTVPVVLVFIQDREYVRKVRNFGIGELASAIERPYSLLYPEPGT